MKKPEEIAKIMTDNGYPMTAKTVSNILCLAERKIRRSLLNDPELGQYLERYNTSDFGFESISR